MKEYDLAIVGGGPSGMIGAIAALEDNPSNSKRKIVLIEKTDSLGKKLLLTGGGRCNIANSMPIKEQLNSFTKKTFKNFLKHSFYTLDNEKLLNFFKRKGLDFKEEENGRYFPITDDAHSVLDILKDSLNELNVDILLNSSVKSIIKNQNDLFHLKTDNSDIIGKNLLIATGGISYPQTGSSGDGYKLSKSFNHNITDLKGGLTSFKIENNSFKELYGLTLNDVEVSYKNNFQNDINKKNKKQNKTYKTKGNILITHFGLSGPAILNLSNFIIENHQSNSNFSVDIDLIPDFSQEELNKKISNDSKDKGKTMIKNYMKYYLKNRFIEFFLNRCDVDGNKTLSNMTKKDKNKIIHNLKILNIEVNDVIPNKFAMITCGGVDIKEINPKTMESKIIPNLYFAGEILEPYGFTGGYNLQIAFSTGYLVGISCFKG